MSKYDFFLCQKIYLVINVPKCTSFICKKEILHLFEKLDQSKPSSNSKLNQ